VHGDASNQPELPGSRGSRNERVAMLSTGLNHRRSCFCDLCAPPAVFTAGKCNNHTQTHGATPLPPSSLHQLCWGMGQSTKLLVNQLHSSLGANQPLLTQDGIPPAHQIKPKQTSSFPKNISALPTQAEMYFPFALAEPRISILCFPAGRIKAGQCGTGPRQRVNGSVAAGCAASGARCSFLIMYMWAAAHRTGEGPRR